METCPRNSGSAEPKSTNPETNRVWNVCLSFMIHQCTPDRVQTSCVTVWKLLSKLTSFDHSIIPEKKISRWSIRTSPPFAWLCSQPAAVRRRSRRRDHESSAPFAAEGDWFSAAGNPHRRGMLRLPCVTSTPRVWTHLCTTVSFWTPPKPQGTQTQTPARR